MRRGAVVAFACAVATAAALGVITENAAAASWCGTTTTQDRPPGLTGATIHVVYAYPEGAPDRSAELAPRMSSDVDEIDAWWRGQDAAREPRFDRTSFACGLQADVVVQRVRTGDGGIANHILASMPVTGSQLYDRYLIYYDGQGDEPDICGEGGPSRSGLTVAIVYLASCTDVPNAAVAAHEILHALGALPAGAPHACPDTPGHPCDSTLDVLYPYASGAPLASLVLDVGRDDYYGHSGSWPDVQDSPWLRLVAQQLRLSLAIAGQGSVASDVPGVDCATSCATDWDAGSLVELLAHPRGGQRFVRWTGACSGTARCALTLDAAKSVTALFAPEQFGIVVSVVGKGRVAGVGASCAVSRCARSGRSYTPVRLRATPAAGWRLAGWSGACAGRSATCTVPMTKASVVRARFVRL